jgi:hypothetical protein
MKEYMVHRCSVRWKCLYQIRAIAVFPVFRLLTYFVSLLTYEFCLSLWKIARCSVILLLPLWAVSSWYQFWYQDEAVHLMWQLCTMLWNGITMINWSLTKIPWNNIWYIGAPGDGNACTVSGPLRFSQFSHCGLILSVCWLMSFGFGRLLGVR